MLSLKSLSLISILTLISIFCFSQENTNGNNNTATTVVKTKTPQATVTFKTPLKVSPLKQQVDELTNYDSFITENVIRELKLSHPIEGLKIVTDEKYDMLSEKQREKVISKSEVIEIINQFK